VYLQNNLDTTYDQEIKGERVVIKPHEKIEVSRSRAVEIRGHMAHVIERDSIRNVKVNLTIIPIPDEKKDNTEAAESATIESDLMLRIAKLESMMSKPSKVYSCIVCDKDFTTRDALMIHVGKAHKEPKDDTGGNKDSH
jgi:hypothetical protein